MSIRKLQTAVTIGSISREGLILADVRILVKLPQIFEIDIIRAACSYNKGIRNGACINGELSRGLMGRSLPLNHPPGIGDNSATSG